MAYDLWYRRQTAANWARRSTLKADTLPDPFSSPKAQEEILAVKQLKLAADRGDPMAKRLWARKLGYLRGMKARAAGGYPDSAHCKRAMEVLAAQGIVVSGWRSISCGVGRSPRTVKGEIVNGRGVSDSGRFVSLMGQGRGFTMWGGPADPLAQLPTKERKAVAQLILLRKRADEGDASAQRVVEAVARLQIFVPPSNEPAKL
jgi:hypothetical protein